MLGSGHQLRGGGVTKLEGGGHVKFYSYKKGVGKVLATLKAEGGGEQQVLG